MIRDAVPDDADAIGAIHVQSWRETYPGIMPRPLLDELDPVARAAGWRYRLTAHANGERHGALIVVVAREELDGEAVGFGSASADPDTGVGEIHTLYLLRRAQGKGLGAALLRGLVVGWLNVARRRSSSGWRQTTRGPGSTSILAAWSSGRRWSGSVTRKLPRCAIAGTTYPNLS